MSIENELQTRVAQNLETLPLQARVPIWMTQRSTELPEKWPRYTIELISADEVPQVIQTWNIDLERSGQILDAGPHASAMSVIRVVVDVAEDVLQGALSVAQAYTSDMLRVSGNMHLAMHLDNLMFPDT